MKQKTLLITAILMILLGAFILNFAIDDSPKEFSGTVEFHPAA
jgi:hypothetical protein